MGPCFPFLVQESDPKLSNRKFGFRLMLFMAGVPFQRGSFTFGDPASKWFLFRGSLCDNVFKVPVLRWFSREAKRKTEIHVGCPIPNKQQHASETAGVFEARPPRIPCLGDASLLSFACWRYGYSKTGGFPLSLVHTHLDCQLKKRKATCLSMWDSDSTKMSHPYGCGSKLKS